ncbi:MAG: response regulator [Streptosporangiales bacterium]|nr:response regulator [Streptosporangiales bacterium]
MGDVIRVLVVDDHPVVRQGLRVFLDLQDDLEVVGEAGDGAEAVDRVAELLPDVVLLDLKMPGVDGVETLRMLRERDVRAKVLVVTSFTDPAAVVPAIRAGAVGYLYKDVAPEALAQGIRSVHAGHALMAPEVATLLASGEPERDRGLASLTQREREVLGELARGRSNREIARAFRLAEKTVKTHVSSILMKLGVADRTQAALYAQRHGLGES